MRYCCCLSEQKYLIYNIFFFIITEVLLDMMASGAELGWLTSPVERGVSLFLVYSTSLQMLAAFLLVLFVSPNFKMKGFYYLFTIVIAYG